jgi:transposase-like protein
MYSYEQRKRAVLLYIKYDFSPSTVIRELGYSNRVMLRKWYAEFKENGDLHRARKARYTPEQRELAITYYKEHGKCIARTVKALGYPCRALLGEWVHAEISSDCRPMKRGVSAVRYTDKQKIDAVGSVTSGEKTARQLEAEIGVRRSTISNWKRQLLGKEKRPEMTKKEGKAFGDSQSEQITGLEAECDKLREERDRLRQQVYKLQMEKDILDKAAEIIKKGKGTGIGTLSNREKAKIAGALCQRYPLKYLLGSLRMAKSSYFYQRGAMRKDKYALVRKKLREAFEKNRECYGYRRLHATLTSEGEIISKKVVLRLMHEERLVVLQSRRRRYSSYKGEISAEVGNILQRDFRSDNPDEKWLSDITEFSIPAGKVYLSPMVDCFDGYVVSWTRGPSPDANLVNAMLDDAIGTLGKGRHPLVHTDRGCHYRWPGWIDRICLIQ